MPKSDSSTTPAVGGRLNLARALSKLGYTSRSQAVRLIQEGRVRLNGRSVCDPAVRCIPERDRIEVDGIPLRKEERLLIALYKPVGIVTTRSDERKRATVYDLLGGMSRWVSPVGRLDMDSAGLLLLTNDTRLGAWLTDPASGVPKVYEVGLDRPMNSEHLRRLARGVPIRGGPTLPARVRSLGGDDESRIEITLHEGRNRQVRRMCEILGYKVTSLLRTKIGNLTLDGLSPGGWRRLSEREIEALTLFPSG